MSFYEYKRDLSNLPPKIRCDVGKEWKTPEHYSKTKLHQFANGLRRTKVVSAANSGIACRVHSGEPETMLKCDGPCGKTYGLDHFSRNTRIRGVYWCNDCTDWQGKNEPGFMPYPVPYAPRDFLGKNGQAGAGRTAGEAENDDTASIAPSVAPSFAPSGTAIPEREHSVVMSAAFGGPMGSSVAPTTEGSVYSDDTYRGKAEPQGGPQQYNAWAPDGVMHRVTKAPTVISEMTTATTTTTTVDIGPSGWIKPATRKTPADAPDYIKFGRCQPTLDDDYHSNDGLSDDEI